MTGARTVRTLMDIAAGGFMNSAAAAAVQRRPPGGVASDADRDAMTRSKSKPAAAWLLGGSGLIPFLAAAAAWWGLQDVHAQNLALTALAGYGAVILSFLGGARWGAALRDAPAGPSWAALTAAVAPSLVGWAGLLLLAPIFSMPGGALLLLSLGFAIMGAWDIAGARKGAWPHWYGRLRLVLTTGAVLSLAPIGAWFWLR